MILQATDVVAIDSTSRVAVRETSAVVQVTRVKEQEVDVFFLIGAAHMNATLDSATTRSYLRSLLHVHHERVEITKITARGQLARTSRDIRCCVPVVGLRGRALLVTEQPAMAVGGVDDVQVSPHERVRRGRDRARRCETLGVDVLVGVLAVCAGMGKGGSRNDECNGELHGRGFSLDVEPAAPRRGLYTRRKHPSRHVGGKMHMLAAAGCVLLSLALQRRMADFAATSPLHPHSSSWRQRARNRRRVQSKVDFRA